MSLNDPFNHVKVQTESGITTLNSLLNRWKVLIETTNTADNQEFEVVSNSLKEAFFDLQENINDLEKTIAIVEGNRTRFQIEDSELKVRKQFVVSCKKKLSSIKQQLQDPQAKAKIEADKKGTLMNFGGKKAQTKYEKLEEAVDNENDDFLAQQQQYQDNIMQHQDGKLDELGQVVHTLGEMSSAINQELTAHNQILEDYHADVEKTQGRLENATRKVNRLLETSKEKKSFCVIIILTLVLIGLIILAITL